jgi:hypothetical protein
MLTALILLIVASALFLPYLLRAIHRIRFIKRLKKICLLKKYKLKIVNPISVLICNSLSAPSVIINTGKITYLIKLWSENSKSSKLIFLKDGTFIKRRNISDVFNSTNQSYDRAVGKLSFSFPADKFKVSNQTVKLLMLEARDSFEILVKDGSIRKISVGEEISGFYVTTMNFYLNFLQK